MNASRSSFSETNREKQLKLCGNCARVSFNLNREETEFLTEVIRRYNAGIFREWLKMKVVKLPGSGQVDPEKAQVISLINSHRVRCSAAKVHVNVVDEHCFLWLPRPDEPIIELQTETVQK